MRTMAESEARPILITDSNGGRAEGTLYVKRFSGRDRVMRALGMLGLMWLLGVISIAIPIAHFVLVPAFLIAGPIAALLRYRATEQFERVTGACPTCGSGVSIDLDSSDRLPLWTYCPPSDDPIHVLETSPAGAGASG